MSPQSLIPPLIAVALLVSACSGITCAGTLTNALITEFVAKNDSGLRDEDGDLSDWIEIWNTSGTMGDLSGWHLTDDPLNLTKWTFPAVEIEAGGRLIVFASSKNRTALPGGMHTNFKLQSTAGGYLALVKPDGTTLASTYSDYPAQLSDISYGSGFATLGTATLIADGASAKWHVPTAAVTDWNAVSFDDSGWSAANMGIGFDIANSYQTHFGAGGDVGNAMSGNASIYIRIPFSVATPGAFSNLKLRMKWEDGFVAHLNGVEAFRQRATNPVVWNSTSDPGGRDEEQAVTFFEYPLNENLLIPGTNVLAIQGLNESSGSSDLIISAGMTVAETDLNSANTGYFPEPTPGAENGARYDGITADTKFSVDRGFQETAFDLIISTATAGATIRYTVDGTPPTESAGTIYTAPIPVNKTTVVRAIAFKAGYQSTNVDTHTYIFPADVVTQPAMRTVITQDPVYGPKMLNALNSVPTIALSFEGNDINRTELPVSVELLNFENGPKQVNAGCVRFGSYVTNFAKRSIRLNFRSQYGTKRLKYPLFDGHDYEIPPVEDFDSLDIRAGNHDMVARGAYMSNRFTDDSMIEMGQISPHGRFVHLYFNGEYRGQYHLREHWNAAMLADYLPGPEEDYDTINANNSGWAFLAGDLQDGDLTEWLQIQTLLAGATPYNSTKNLLDVPNLIDFMLLWTYGTSESEFRAGGSISNGVGFKFQIKDADGFLQPPSGGNLPPGGFQPATHNGPLNAMTRFRTEANPEFMILLADRIHKHFFNDGALTPDKSSSRLLNRLDECRLSYIAESARWGTHAGAANRTPAQWEAYHDYFFTTEFPALTAQRIGLLRAAGMYPKIIAPVLSQHGGSIPVGAGITMRTDATGVYYTLDGSDPRLEGGMINATAIQATFDGSPPSAQDFVVSGDVWKFLDDGSNQGTAWRAAAFDDGAWDSGPSELGYGESDEATKVAYVDTDPVKAGPQRNATTYFRHNVTVGAPSAFSSFRISLKYDDGAAVYVNGVEAVRTATLAVGAAFDEFALSSTPNENAFYDFDVPSSRFVAGLNTIAVEIHNESAASSDISFDLILRGLVDASAGPNLTLPVMLTDAAPFNARAYNVATGKWSALTSTYFSINSVPASASNLVISEIHYHPAEPVTAGELAISTDRDDYEFIELLNIGTQPVDLTGVHFSQGITFAFTENTILAAGERIVIVRNAAAFAERYGLVAVAGEYAGRLSNDGEQLTLSLTGSGDIGGLIYNDVTDWPTLADGHSYSMVLVDPASNPDDDLPGNWAAHTLIGGAPGLVDTTQFGYGNWKHQFGISDDLADSDGDGVSTLLEYALGTSPSIPDSDALPVPDIFSTSADQYLTISFDKNPQADDLVYQLQQSADLAIWTNISAIESSPGVYHSPEPIPANGIQFLRLAVSFK